MRAIDLTQDRLSLARVTTTSVSLWQHVYCAAMLAANTSMRGVEVKHVRRKDCDAQKRVIHIRTSKKETSKHAIAKRLRV